nr:MAG TPA: hypothetical protein [Caudoviricetes sp.]
MVYVCISSNGLTYSSDHAVKSTSYVTIFFRNCLSFFYWKNY